MVLIISLHCPRCGGKLRIVSNRPRGFIARWGYKAVCDVCKWREDLQEAQRGIMEKEEYSHPHYWAPFILVGDWE